MDEMAEETIEKDNEELKARYGSSYFDSDEESQLEDPRGLVPLDPKDQRA